MSNLHPIFEEILQAHNIIQKPKMQYNECKTCGAKDGRAGMLINDECLNCHDTRKTGEATIHTNLSRLPEEIVKTLNILIYE
jgi:hypothetical protein